MGRGDKKTKRGKIFRGIMENRDRNRKIQTINKENSENKTDKEII